jgi:hypothetical protein
LHHNDGQEHQRRRNQASDTSTIAGTNEHPLNQQRRGKAKQAGQSGQGQCHEDPSSVRREQSRQAKPWRHDSFVSLLKRTGEIHP